MLNSVGNHTRDEQIGNHTRDKQIGLPLGGRLILLALV